MPAAYVTRLRLEGGALAATGALASAALVARVPDSRRWWWNTAAQVGVVTAALLTRGPRQVDTWMAAADRADETAVTGEPTPIVHVPVPVLAGALLFRGLREIRGPLRPLTEQAGWDASLRVTLGSAVVGAVQALVLAPHVAAAEAREGRVYYRLPGSRLGTGTRLGYVER
jgi:hypothetical protein